MQSVSSDSHCTALFAHGSHSYKPDVQLRFVTEELGFESDEECAQFLCEFGGQAYLEERSETGVRLLTGKVGNTFELAKSTAFKRVDIKGQI